MNEGAWLVVVASVEPLAVDDRFDIEHGPVRVVLAPPFRLGQLGREQLTASIRRAAVVGQAVVSRLGTVDRSVVRDGYLLSESGQLDAMHRRLAFQLETLDGFTAERPERWRDGYQPRVVAGAEAHFVEAELDVSGVVVLEQDDQAAVVRAVLESPSIALFDRPVLMVAVPTGSDSSTLEVIGGAEDLGTTTFLAVETDDGLRIATSRALGIRYRHGQLLGTDLHLADTARQAVFRVLSEQIPVESGTDEDTLRAQTEWLQEESERIGSLVWDSRVWTTRPIKVDGATFALFSSRQDGLTAAVLDLGYARVSITGREIPADLALSLIRADSVHSRWHRDED